jgi:hypothetical protein
MTRTEASSPSRPRGYKRRERLLARWRLSTIVAAVVAVVAVGAVLTAALSLGGFGVPIQSAPRTINPKDVPFGLLGQVSPSTVTTTAAPHHFSQPEILWFIDSDGRLEPEAASVPTPVSIESILDALLKGPSSTANLQTAIPAGAQVLSARVSAGLVTVDLSSQIEGVSGEPLIQAFAQLVYTATPISCPAAPPKRKLKTTLVVQPTTTTTTTAAKSTLAPPCADKVSFEVGGQPLPVPIATGAQTSRPVTRADYSSLSS